MKNKKKVVLPKITEESRKQSVVIANKNRIKNNDGLTSHKRKEKKIKEISNGCWWLSTYLKGK